MNPIRVGQISFTNILPLYLFFDRNHLNTEFIPQVPTGLNQSMAEGTIDMGPISSFAYAENQDQFTLLPDLSISAHGPVQSIFLFTKGKALHELDALRVAVTNTSASSVALLRILLEKFEEIEPIYITMESDLIKMMAKAEACLLIGDEAIKAQWSHHDYTVFDLGEEWYKRTGLSMTFAVWAVRNEMIATRQEELKEIHSRFLHARSEGMRCRERVIAEAQKKLGGETSFWSTYFEGLCYHLGEKEINGLQTYYDYAYELGLIENKVDIRILCFPTKVIQGECNEPAGNLSRL